MTATAQFKAKIQTDESGTFIMVPKITPRHVTNKGGLGQMAHLSLESKLGFLPGQQRILTLPSDKVVCVNGGFLSEFQITR